MCISAKGSHMHKKNMLALQSTMLLLLNAPFTKQYAMHP